MMSVIVVCVNVGVGVVRKIIRGIECMDTICTIVMGIDIGC